MSSGVSRFNALQIGLLWQRLAGLIDEAAQVFVRASFSSVVRDNWDMALGLMDSQGRQIVQSAKSVPSFIGTMPRTLAVMLAKFPPARLAEGDVLVSNDAYHGTGHLNDVTMVKPLYRRGRLIGFIGSTFHSVDIGGAPSVEARDAWEEGLTIPVLKIVEGGTENPDARPTRRWATCARSSPLTRRPRGDSRSCSTPRGWTAWTPSSTTSSRARRRACAAPSRPCPTARTATRSASTASTSRC
jgi:N-methylhydantoinase B/oxoprolinase/acetone carboxylase alpha subunit